MPVVSWVQSMTLHLTSNIKRKSCEATAKENLASSLASGRELGGGKWGERKNLRKYLSTPVPSPSAATEHCVTVALPARW